MLSFVNSFRAVARHQSCRLPAARAISSAPAQTTMDVPNSMSEFNDYIYDVAEERETLRAGNTGELVEEVTAPADSLPPPVSAKGFPVLRGFQGNQFVRPQNFTRDGYAKMSQRAAFTKRPLLGPDASTSRYLDVFHQMDVNPLNECQNSKIMSQFVTTMGKIKGRAETNLTWKNQRRVGKAIRRAKMMGIIPVLSRRTLLYDTNRR